VSYFRLCLDRSRFEIRIILRDRNAVVFMMLLPIFLLVIFGSIFASTKIGTTNVRFSQYIVAGLLASGILYSSFQQFAIAIPEERMTGSLKRLAGSPMPTSIYFVGKFAVALFIYIFQAIFLLGIGHFAYHVALPGSAYLWVTFVWVSLLGLIASSLLGIAFSSIPKDGKSAGAMTTPIVLFFQFTSGVYFIYTNLPAWMQDVAALFPLKWMAQAMRGVFLPKYFAASEAARSYEFPKAALVMAIWAIIGGVLCLRTFRWLDEG
jgi:ABC-2 type transport system permease protein